MGTKANTTAKASLNANLGAVSTSEVYPLEVFKRLTGLDTWAIRRARRDGLRVVKVGRRQYVRGSSFAEFLAGREETKDSSS